MRRCRSALLNDEPRNPGIGDEAHHGLVLHGTTQHTFEEGATAVHRDQVFITWTGRITNMSSAQVVLPGTGPQQGLENIGRVLTERAAGPAEQAMRQAMMRHARSRPLLKRANWIAERLIQIAFQEQYPSVTPG
jgi:hypothetical protein